MATNNTYAGINAQQTKDINNVNATYNKMINNSDRFYNQQIKAAKDYEKTQTNLQNQQTEQAINEINQNKEYQKQDYLKEQKGAYADWQKQSNQYGANAEANAKMLGSGYSESSQVQMYTAYQNRVATAKESYTRAVTDYNNQITNARLQNNVALADIAYKSLQKQLELSLQGFQYKNTLIQQKLDEKNKIKDRYYTRWNDLRNYKQTRRAFDEQKREFNKEYELKKKQLASSSSSGGSSSGSSGGYSSYYSGSSSSSSGGSVKLTTKKNSKKTNKTTSGWVSSGKPLTNLVASKGYSAATNLDNLVKAGVLQKKVINGKTYYR